jgi:hypothetical protein
MQQIKLMSKLGLAVIAITAISVAMGVQAYYIQAADAQVRLPNNSVRTETIVNGQVQTDDLANGAVTSDKLASGAVGLTTTFRTGQENVPAGVNSVINANCNDGEVVTGGGYSFGSVFDRDVEIFLSAPEGNSWRVFADNHHASESALVTAYAVCATLVP